jgi:hypothetical protein
MILAGELKELVEKCKGALESAGYCCMQSTVTSTNPQSDILKVIIILDALGVIEFRRSSPPAEG